jgi:hypothetical protein
MNYSEVGFFNSSRAGKSIRFRTCHIEVRFLLPQPRIPVFREFSFLDEKGPPNVGFSHRQ